MKNQKPHKLSFFLSHPVAGLLFLAGKKDLAHRTQILGTANALWKNTQINSSFRAALDELESLNARQEQIVHKKNSGGNRLNSTFGKWIWCCVRVFQPEVMVETGVSHGHSSKNILDAMHRNGKGRLYSIDLPNQDTNPAYNFKGQSTDTGWAVPEELRNRWELILGDARTELPALLERLGTIDIFFHDSDHSYQHMLFEFESTLPHLKSHGILLSDDVDKNDAFMHFTRTHGLPMHRFNKGGVAIVPS